MSQKNDLMNNNKAFSWLAEPEKPRNIYDEYTVDVLIVGAGHAGTAAARSAIENNPEATVMVIEQQKKNKQVILGVGEIGHINSKWQEEWNIPKVNIDEFVNDWQMRTNNRSNYGLIRKYAEHCGENFDWMIEVLDEEEKAQIVPMLKNPSEHMPTTLNGIHAYPGTAYMPVKVQNSMIKKNQKLAEDKGVVFKFGSKLYQILTANGKIIGAYIQTENGFELINVNKGIILAAGDYSKNPQMCRDLLTEAADLIEQGTVFPARAGVILVSKISLKSMISVPRASGGDPGKMTISYQVGECSPRERG